jgi:hypothetical protein
MELPDDVLALISAFSKPLTRPNWRQSKPILSTYQLFLVTIKKIEDSWQFTRYDDLYTNIKGTDWYWSYTNIRDFGLDIYYRHYQRYYGEVTTIHNIQRVDGLSDAILQHKYLYGSMNIFK